MHWDAAAYDNGFRFVTDYGSALIDLLDLDPAARVLDVGCGTGEHAAELMRRGFQVVGIDADAAMVRRARETHPEVRFVLADAEDLHLGEMFDAAFSNAALHWMTDQRAALRSVRRHLVAGAPLVAEMGGRGNVAVVDAALEQATAHLGLSGPPIRKFFPSLGEQATLLEDAGFEVDSMWAFARPTRLSAGQRPSDWTRLFRANVWAAVPPLEHELLAAAVDERCAELHDEAGWWIDYRRLRFCCHAV